MPTPQITDDRWRDGDWFRVHNAIVTHYAEEVTSTYALAVYVVLACHADRGGTSWASHKTMAREARCSEPQVRRSLAMLEAAGLLAIEPRFIEGRQTSNRYRLLPVTPKGGDLPEQADDLGETGAPPPQSGRGAPTERPWNQTHGTRPKEPEDGLTAIWNAVLADLQEQMVPANYARWLARTSLLSRQDGTVVVGVPDAVSAQQLAKRFDPLIRRALADACGETVTVEYRPA